MCSFHSSALWCSPWCWKCRSVSLAACERDWHGFQCQDRLNLTWIWVFEHRGSAPILAGRQENNDSLPPHRLFCARTRMHLQCHSLLMHLSSDRSLPLHSVSTVGWVWHEELRQSFNMNPSIPLTLALSHTHTCSFSCIQTPLVLSTFPPTSHPCPVYNIAALLGSPISPSALHPHMHENQGSWTPASHGSVITEWIDCVCVKCERRLCGFNTLCLAYKFTSTQRCLSLVWQEKMRERDCVFVSWWGIMEKVKELWQMGNKKKGTSI